MQTRTLVAITAITGALIAAGTIASGGHPLALIGCALWVASLAPLIKRARAERA